MPVPSDVQIPLILKILTFDRNFEVKITTALTIGIVYDPQNPASLQGKDAIAQSLAPFTTKTIKKLPIAYTRVLPIHAAFGCCNSLIGVCS